MTEPNPATQHPDTEGEPVGDLPDPSDMDGHARPRRDFYAECPLPDQACDFVTDGWDTQEAADTRLAEHLAEHRTGQPAPELLHSAATTGGKLTGEVRRHARTALRQADTDGHITMLEASE